MSLKIRRFQPIKLFGGRHLNNVAGDHAVQSLAISSSGPAMRVLAAEDNPVFQSMLKSMLTKWGYKAVIARSGTEAWRILEAEDAPRLAVLDWMMPGMDGVEICRRIRSANREPYIYILLLTARTESQDLIEGMDAGADDYLTKPFNAHELRVRLHAGPPHPGPAEPNCCAPGRPSASRPLTMASPGS